MGDISRAIDSAVGRIGRALQKARALSEGVASMSRDIGEAPAVLRRGLSSQIADTDDAVQAVRDVAQALGGTVRQAEAVRDETRLAGGIATRLASVALEQGSAMEE